MDVTAGSAFSHHRISGREARGSVVRRRRLKATAVLEMELLQDPAPPLLPVVAASCLLVSIGVVGLWLFDSLYPIGISSLTRLLGSVFARLV